MSAFERAAVARLVEEAERRGVEVPDVVRAAATTCGSWASGAVLHVEQYPEAEDIGCCMGAVIGGLGKCTCWVPEYDVEQADPSLDVVLEHGIQTRATRCGDCAYRRDSPENTEVYTAEQLIHLAATGEPFWCHDGMRRPARWRHPQRPEVVTGSGDDWQPAVAEGIPWRADGRPALLCAGWAAEGKRQERALAKLREQDQQDQQETR